MTLKKRIDLIYLPWSRGRMERKERLDTLGMSWDPHSTDWDAMFDLLKASPKLLECWPSEAPRGKGKGKVSPEPSTLNPTHQTLNPKP